MTFDDLPNRKLRDVLDQFGIPRPMQTRDNLLDLVKESMNGWCPADRSTDQLAQIVLNLHRERRLMLATTRLAA